MTDPDDENEQAFVLDAVEDAVVTHAQSQRSRTTLDRNDACRSRISTEDIDPGGDP